MKAIISGKDIGTTISFRSLGSYEAKHPWPEETVVSAGRGVVFSRNPEKPNYTTLFMEVYPPGAAFIRGEGETPEACEESCWQQYQRAIHCVDGRTSHEWEPRGYMNGAGFCKHCNTFGTRIFTGEQLGQFCHDCGVGTTHNWETGPDGSSVFLCAAHTAPMTALSPEELLAQLTGKQDPARGVCEDEAAQEGARHEDHDQ
ncbi:hypothetical protein ACFVU2_19280 [Leifsonia sp. NPDC058194]|uniref:hypothetical protein n=1 Tax=Leifsonia sp. NPDC058194 TaxID=3346374 RepID=UPI0036DA3490